ncbi:MAG: TAXI family TRAP transporter solute-binding subunit [Deltaproteobacteria bacterium]|nr:MAG: TAXI family TRAP transporter solute-binding subunit [Deltaproteobacteria bacterium]UCH08130.1 MAG: TAXI family TRAP transporter solute-binding subunit [Deltaproteobacteria bacterium]
MKTKKLLVLSLGFLFVLTLITTSFIKASAESELPKRVTFALGQVGTTAYAVGSGMAKVASQSGPIMVVARATAGPAAFVHQMNDTGVPELGMLGAIDAWQAYTGKIIKEPIPGDPRKKPPYWPPTPNIRVLLQLPSFYLGFLVRDKSEMKTVADIKGKRMAWEFPGFPPNIPSTLAYMTCAGVTLDDVKPVPMTGLVAALEALIDGRIDVTTAAVGMGAVAEADAKIGVRFLRQSIASDEWLKKAQMIMPGSFVATKKAGPPGLKVDTPLWTKPYYAVCSSSMPDNVAYTLVKTWWNHYEETWPIHVVLKDFKSEIFATELAPIAYHTGAIKFYKEKGVWTSDIEEAQREFSK